MNGVISKSQIREYIKECAFRETGTPVCEVTNIGEAPNQLRHCCPVGGISFLPQRVANCYNMYGVIELPYYECAVCGKLYLVNEVM